MRKDVKGHTFSVGWAKMAIKNPVGTLFIYFWFEYVHGEGFSTIWNEIIGKQGEETIEVDLDT